jgi:hypothetical protein
MTFRGDADRVDSGEDDPGNLESRELICGFQARRSGAYGQPSPQSSGIPGRERANGIVRRVAANSPSRQDGCSGTREWASRATESRHPSSPVLAERRTSSPAQVASRPGRRYHTAPDEISRGMTRGMTRDRSANEVLARRPAGFVARSFPGEFDPAGSEAVTISFVRSDPCQLRSRASSRNGVEHTGHSRASSSTRSPGSPGKLAHGQIG